MMMMTMIQISMYILIVYLCCNGAGRRNTNIDDIGSCGQAFFNFSPFAV